MVSARLAENGAREFLAVASERASAIRRSPMPYGGGMIRWRLTERSKIAIFGEHLAGKETRSARIGQKVAGTAPQGDLSGCS